MGNQYGIRYTREAADDLRPLRTFDQRRIIDGIFQHLAFEPKRVSRSRIKEMERPFWSQYRLRVDDFRVYYDVDDDQHVVVVLRVLLKGTAATPPESP